MNRNRDVRLVILTLLFCFCGVASSFAQLLKLTPEYYHIKDFKLKSGAVIEDLKIEYATMGTPKKDSQGNIVNAVVFCHGFSGNYSQIKLLMGMVGPGKPFDPEKYFFILPTAIGSPGSSCPRPPGRPRSGRARWRNPVRPREGCPDPPHRLQSPFPGRAGPGAHGSH